MTVHTRQSGGPFLLPVIPAPDIFTITDAPHGGWTQIPEARALYWNGYTYIAWINGSSGDAELAVWNNSTNTLGTPIALHGSALDSPPDTHDSPGMIVEANSHKLIVAYSPHAGSPMYLKISANSLDSDPTLSGGFPGEGAAVTGTVTYPIFVQRNAETNDPIYLFYRSGTNTLRYVKSLDGGVHWGSAVTVYSGAMPYWQIISDGQWRIDFLVSSSNPQEATSKVGHFYADDVSYHKSDGTNISPVFPFTFGEISEVYDSADGPGWWVDAMYDENGDPAGLFSVDIDSHADGEVRYARWDGDSWVTSTVLASVGEGVVDGSPIPCLDQVNPTHAHLIRKIAGVYELWRYTRTGDTWDAGVAITAGSSEHNMYPMSVKDHPDGELAILWLVGSYTTYNSNSLGIHGLED